MEAGNFAELFLLGAVIHMMVKTSAEIEGYSP
jgi:hypothetical protein